MRWLAAEIADVMAQGLVQRAQADDLEQAVYGFDALDELKLHPVLKKALLAGGWGVHREVRYPGQRTSRKKSRGQRCDLVLTPEGQRLRDPQVAGTLFDDRKACDLDAAYWLEVKTVAMFEPEGPFARYSAELLNPVARDVKKIWSDGVIRFGGLLLVLFTDTQATAEHDLRAWHERLMERGFPVGPPCVRGLPITDRIGNGWCSAAVYGVRGL